MLLLHVLLLTTVCSAAQVTKYVGEQQARNIPGVNIVSLASPLLLGGQSNAYVYLLGRLIGPKLKDAPIIGLVPPASNADDSELWLQFWMNSSRSDEFSVRCFARTSRIDSPANTFTHTFRSGDSIDVRILVDENKVFKIYFDREFKLSFPQGDRFSSVGQIHIGNGILDARYAAGPYRFPKPYGRDITFREYSRLDLSAVLTGPRAELQLVTDSARRNLRIQIELGFAGDRVLIDAVWDGQSTGAKLINVGKLPQNSIVDIVILAEKLGYTICLNNIYCETMAYKLSHWTVKTLQISETLEVVSLIVAEAQATPIGPW